MDWRQQMGMGMGTRGGAPSAAGGAREPAAGDRPSPAGDRPSPAGDRQSPAGDRQAGADRACSPGRGRSRASRGAAAAAGAAAVRRAAAAAAAPEWTEFVAQLEVSTGLCDGERLGSAAAAGECADIEDLLAAGAEVDAVNEYGETALYRAACHGEG